MTHKRKKGSNHYHSNQSTQMGFACAICSVSLEKPPARNPNEPPPTGNEVSNLSTTPCGHIFHTFCINKWNSGGSTSNRSCPCCRKPVQRCMPIFPDSYDESLNDTDDFGTSSQVPIPCNHMPRIVELEEEIAHSRRTIEQNNQMYSLLAEECQGLNDKLIMEKHANESYQMKYAECKSYRDLYKKEQQEKKSLEEDLARYGYVESLLNGVRFEASEDLKNFPVNKDSIKSLIQVKYLLQNELESSRKKEDSFKKDIDKFRTQALSYKAKIVTLEKDISEYELANNTLRQKIESAKIHTPSPCTKTTLHLPTKFRTSKAEKSEKPKKLNLGSKPTKPSGPLNLNQTILVTDSEDESIDKDVGVMQPFTSISSKRARAAVGTLWKDTDTTAKKSKLHRSGDDDFKEHGQILLNARSCVPGVAPMSPTRRGTTVQKHVRPAYAK